LLWRPNPFEDFSLPREYFVPFFRDFNWVTSSETSYVFFLSYPELTV
jgi:hypothetical protein